MERIDKASQIFTQQFYSTKNIFTMNNAKTMPKWKLPIIIINDFVIPICSHINMRKILEIAGTVWAIDPRKKRHIPKPTIPPSSNLPISQIPRLLVECQLGWSFFCSFFGKSVNSKFGIFVHSWSTRKAWTKPPTAPVIGPKYTSKIS